MYARHSIFRLLFATLLIMPLHPACAQTESYDVAFDRGTARTRTDRVLTAIFLDDVVHVLPQPRLMYNDLTPQCCFVVRPGQRVQPVFAYSGTWMQGYVYIDLNRNGRFDVRKPLSSGKLQPNNELMTFAGMECSNGKFNSAGQQLNNLSAVQPPAFTIPDTLAEGTYMMRWKVDWDSADPAGRTDASNHIVDNGGAIVDVLLKVSNDAATGAYELMFSDEFDQPDGSRPDSKKWRSSTRYSSTWNRWISPSADVAFISDGHLVCRAIPNPDRSTDDVPMITGAVETRDKFAFTYGKVEVCLRTTNHAGNFPAAWMMPQPPTDGWPKGGEIDIFECIDSENKSYHTVHSNWTYNLGHKNDPKSSFSRATNVEEWHVYGLIWTENALIWTVDGTVVGTYMKADNPEALSQGQWPFTHPFYIILNQSVGNGSWAKAADTSFTYETRFDWVRVYRMVQNPLSGIGHTHASSAQASPYVFDLSGRRVGAAKPSTHSSLRPGIYIRSGKKVVVSGQ